ncbi:MAG TPA: GPW/gp25 family protein [Gemmatimonadaceae bacterium]|nr:GPW/gp25 family protein [Gemmatimonadaceae bacterium]
MTSPLPIRSAVGVGWPLLPIPDADGVLAWPGTEASVRQTIEVILRTRPGEQLMRPRFGGGLEQFVHEPNTLLTRRRIHDSIVDALGRWEPRVDVDRVEVWEIPDRPTEVRVEIAYRLRRTGAVEQIGLTMSTSG